MSMADRTQPTVRQFSGSEPLYDDDGTGWVLFAAAMLSIVAALNFVDGVAAVSNSKFFVGSAQFVIGDLKTWGWILMAVAVVQGIVVAGILMERRGFRWAGVAIAALNAIAQLLFMPAYPLWSLALFAIDILIIYGLIAHGAVSRD